MKGEKKMEENVMIVPDEEIGVDELEENLTGEVEQQQAEENDELVAALRQGLGELFEDGWTTGELDAMTQDEGVKREIASGHGVVRAACGYLKRMLETAAARKGNVPIARTTAAGAVRPGSAIEQMSDREFAAFSKRAQEAMMAGKKAVSYTHLKADGGDSRRKGRTRLLCRRVCPRWRDGARKQRCGH